MFDDGDWVIAVAQAQVANIISASIRFDSANISNFFTCYAKYWRLRREIVFLETKMSIAQEVEKKSCILSSKVSFVCSDLHDFGEMRLEVYSSSA